LLCLSAFVSTYFNTKFLIEFESISALFSSFSLTLIRFFASFFIGLMFYEREKEKEKEKEKQEKESYSFFLFFFPSPFLVIANFSNSLALSLTGITVT
jgi:hypothetical protein